MSAYNGVILPENFIVLSAADFEKIVQRRVSELAAVPLSLKEAAFAYGCDQRTILRRIKDGDIKGDKCGGKWSIETPAQRAARVNI